MTPRIQTRIWQEEPEDDNPFATRKALCRGYDVYGDMLGNARWVDMLYLLFKEDAPNRAEADLLETLAVALANPGPRDAAVHAAMCGGVGGSAAAACLMAALATGAGGYGGGREVKLAMEAWQTNQQDLSLWQTSKAMPPASDRISPWPAPEHAPGFDPHGVSTATTILQTLNCLAERSPGPCLPWLKQHRQTLEAAASSPLALTGVAAATFTDLGFDPEQGEMLYLLLRLPGAAAHALEQSRLGHKKFPFFEIELETTPAGATP